MKEVILDHDRLARIGLEEAILSLNKTLTQLNAIIDEIHALQSRKLFTRLSPEAYASIDAGRRELLDYDEISRTAFLGEPRPLSKRKLFCVVTAGASDIRVALEAVRTLRYYGEEATLVADVGVAGLWRLNERVDDIAKHPIVIVVAGMDAAIASVLGGLIASAIVAVPTSTGYGAAAGGMTALSALLVSCSPGITVVNIDNGYGAACAGLRLLRALSRIGQ